MKKTCYCQAKFNPYTGYLTAFIPIQAREAFKQFFTYKENRDKRDKTDIHPELTLFIEAKEKTFKQRGAFFKLLRIMFISENGREPSSDELYEYYNDFLDAYADRKPNRFTGELSPIHVSENDVYSMSRLITAAIDRLVTECDLKPSNEYWSTTNMQADVQQIINRWQVWRGSLENDPVDFMDYEKKLAINKAEWYKRHKISDASGLTPIVLAHIVSRGAATCEEPWNWLALTPSEHNVQHAQGWEYLINRFPHLKGRIDRARKLAGKKPL